MQKSRVLFLATVLVSAIMFYAVTSAFALGTGRQSLWGNQSVSGQYTVTGVIQAKNGNVWTIDGKEYTVDPLTVSGGPTNIGDPITLNVSVVKSAVAAQPSDTPMPSATSPSKPEIKDVVTATPGTSFTETSVEKPHKHHESDENHGAPSMSSQTGQNSGSFHESDEDEDSHGSDSGNTGSGFSEDDD